MYAVTATVISAVENSKFSAADFDSFASRSDELGILARVLQQIVETINSQQSEITKVEKKLEISASKQQSLIIQTLEERFGDLPQATINRILSLRDLDRLNQLLHQAIAIDSLGNLDL